ncbi:Uncharacterised protein [Legionella beliardensis]|uniref:Transmembrane protein n=1 Tax=Legionella beliardensis TaxID=91822 RepID=A0A378I493_9GAMM|nr:DUF6790 family protein [Legionella beliardensis]STX30027.1 Uncharacterised protein [Legionella beliardensis]
MQNFIVFVLSNFTLTFFILSIISAAISLFIKRKHLNKALTIEVIFSHFLLFNIGFSLLYNFVMHVFFGDITAKFIGWADSPFQIELGFASLGFAILGILSFWASSGFRAATIIAPAIFLWGAAGVHIYNMVATHNFAPGNAGVIFWTDIFIPLLGFILLYLQYKTPIRKIPKR